MNRLSFTMIGVVVVALAISCAPEQTEETPAAPQSSDPTVVDAQHYAIEFENDRVRILRTRYGPGEESAMHAHPDHVAVMLTSSRGEMRGADGSTEAFQAEAGEALFAPAGSHVVQNLAAEPMEAVLVELKPGASTETAAGSAGPDPTVVDARHYTAKLDNDRVRVVHIRYGAGEKSVMHHHPASIAVFLTDHHVEFENPDGSKTEVHKKAGEHLFVPAGQHLPKNIGTEPWEVVLVELK